MSGSAARPLALAALLLAIAAGWLSPRAERLRSEAGLDRSPEPGLEVPADIRLIETALGSFRGWLICGLWLRSMQLEDEGRRHEAMQLARLITRLQPHFPEVWSYQAHNLIYNLSLAARDPAERWLWIESGISLLRDEAIPLHLESRKLYGDLAFAYSFKIGIDSRDEHREYLQLRHAQLWQALLGVPQGADAESRARWLEPVARAPRGREELYSRHPELAEERGALESALGDDPMPLLAEVARAERGEGPLAAWLADPVRGSGRREFVAQVRAERIRARYRMDPELLVELTRAFGPIDWRHPAAHAVYWGAVGALRIETHEAFPRLASDRLPAVYRETSVGIGLQQLAASGRVVGEVERGELRYAPEWGFVDDVERTIFGGDPERAAEVPERYRAGYFRILKAAVESAWLRGEDAEAERALARLRQHYAEASPDPLSFIRVELEAELPDDPEERGAEIADRVRGQYFEMFREGWGAKEAVIAQRRRELAETLRSRAELSGTPLPALEELERSALDLFLHAGPWIASPSRKSEVWRRLPPERRAGFPDSLLERLRDEARRSELDPESAFPR